MATSTLEVVIRGRDLLTPTLNKVESGLKGLGATADGLKGGILAGIGIGAGIGAFTLAQTAVTKFNDVLQESVSRALEDEASVKRLTVALHDNAPAWDGSLQRVNAFVTKGEQLAFTDDAVRDSITKLSASTGDVGRAMALSSTAMDLARLRGIDLSTATDMIAKAQAGNIGALRRVLPFIDANATATEALAAIQKAAAGQAEAYANTSEGRLVRAQISAAEASEKLGYALMPIVADAAKGAADALDIYSVGLQAVSGTSSDGAESSSLLSQALGGLLGILGPVISSNNDLARQLLAAKAAAEATAAAVGDEQAATRIANEAAAAAGVSTNVYTGAIGRMGTAAQIATERLRALNGTMGWTGGVTANAQTGFTVTTEQQRQALIDATNAHQDYLASLGKNPTANGAAATATDRQRSAVDRLIEAIKRLDDAQETLFRRQIANLDKVIQKQLDAISAARQARDDARQAAADAKDLKGAESDLVQATKSGSGEAILRAQERLKDVQDRIEEEKTRKHEDELAKQLKATQDYIDAVAQLESNATNRKALANTLSKREQVLGAQRAAALAAGDTEAVGMIDMKLEAIRAAEKRNAQAMDNATATAKAQEFVSVHTTINLDGKVLADVVDKYLYKR